MTALLHCGGGGGEEYVDRNDTRNKACHDSIEFCEWIQIIRTRKKFLETRHTLTDSGPENIQDRSGAAVDRPGPEPGTGLVWTLFYTCQ